MMCEREGESATNGSMEKSVGRRKRTKTAMKSGSRHWEGYLDVGARRMARVDVGRAMPSRFLAMVGYIRPGGCCGGAEGPPRQAAADEGVL